MPVFSLSVNGVDRRIEVPSDMPLLWVLRDHLELTGTKFGCGIGACGACAVLVDGRQVRSCSFPVSQVRDRKITTIEGLAGPLKEAWIEADVPQCGYCQAGQIIAAAALLRRKPKPTDTDINEALGSHLCRCGTYDRIRKAVKLAAGVK